MSFRRVAAVVIAALVVAATPVVAADVESELADVEARVQRLESSLSGASQQRTEAVATILDLRDDIAALEADRDMTVDSLREIRSERRVTRRSLRAVQEQLQVSYLALADVAAEIADGEEEAVVWVRRRYTTPEVDLVGMALVSADVGSVALGAEYLERLSAVTDARINRYEALQTQHERQRALIVRQETEIAQQLEVVRTIELRLASVDEELASRATELEDKVREQRSLLDDLDAEIAHFSDELDTLEQEQARLETLLTERQGESGDAPGVLVRPVPGAITSAFGPRLHPILGYTRKHTGIDMSAATGQTIVAAGPGRVILAAPYGGYGNTVIVDHGGGMTTLYAHQSRLSVARGDTVDAGEKLGEAGSTGLATGSHLHFEVRLWGTPVDPVPYL